MSLLWARVGAWADAMPQARDHRVDRVKRWVDKQQTHPGRHPGFDIPESFGHYTDPKKVFEMSHNMFGVGDLIGNVHTHHLPWKDVALDGTFHTTQGTVRPDIVHRKIDSQHGDEESDYPEHDEQYDEHDPSEDPIVVHKGGQHYLLDGHHRFVEHRLLGKPSMMARVFDADDPKAGPEHCHECQEHKEHCSDCGGTPEWDR